MNARQDSKNAVLMMAAIYRTVFARLYLKPWGIPSERRRRELSADAQRTGEDRSSPRSLRLRG